MDKKIREIIKYGVMAPSGDNSQPWRFVLSGSKVKIFNLPDKDNPYLNFMQAGSLIAHGALLKNIEIASTKFGLVPEILLFPVNENVNLVASINFKDISSALITHPLFEFISKRSTNRRPYEKKEFAKNEEGILKEAGTFQDVSLRFITDEKNKIRAGAAGSSAEIIILENKLLHGYLFKDIMWSEKEERRERHGLYINTMEFNPIQKLLFRLASNRVFMNIAVKIKFPYFIAKQDASLYSSGSALGLLTIKSVSLQNFVKLGMKMQEVWLKATSFGLAFQPITATLFFGFILQNNNEDKTLHQKHKDIALKSFRDIYSIFNLEDYEKPFVMFRIGYAKKPSAYSTRKEPVFEIEN